MFFKLIIKNFFVMEAITEEQIKALKYLIYKSEDAGPETKKACFALIDASEGLTKPVCFTGYSADINSGVNNMISPLGSTHLNRIMEAMGTNFRFSFDEGYFDKGEFKHEIRPGKNRTNTIWLSAEEHDKQAREVSSDEFEMQRFKVIG